MSYISNAYGESRKERIVRVGEFYPFVGKMCTLFRVLEAAWSKKERAYFAGKLQGGSRGRVRAAG